MQHCERFPGFRISIKGLFTFALCLACQFGFSQSERWVVDASAGLVNSNILKDGSSVGSALTNPYAGLSLTTPTLFLTDTQPSIRNFRLSLSPRYQILGADFNDPRYKHKFHYIGFPLQAKVELFSSFDFKAGVSGGYLLTNFRSSSNTNQENFPIEEPGFLHWWATGGLEMALSQRLGLQISYQRSLKQLPNAHQFQAFRLGLNYQLNTNDPRFQKPGEKEQRERRARYHIQQLKKGMLLVRLTSNHQQITRLKQDLREMKGVADSNDAKGKHKQARKASLKANQKQERLASLKAKTRQRNQNLIEAFNKAFDFCDYAFFYDYQTDSVLKENWSRVAFQNLQGQGLSINKQKPRYILDVGSSFLKREHRTYEGMVIRDTSLKVLKSPFPAKIPNSQTFDFAGLDKSPLKMVRKLNEELKSYWGR